MFNDRLEVHNNTMVEIQHTKIDIHTLPWARAGGGARISVHRHPPPPSPGKSNTFFYYMGGLSATISPCGGFLLRFSLYGWPFSPCEDFCSLSLHVEAFFNCYVFLLMEGLFHHVRDFLLPFLHMEGLFCSQGGLLWAGAHAHYIYYNIVIKCINNDNDNDNE